MKTSKQQGFALFVSMIMLIILTLIGFSIANKGRLSAQVAQTSSRYQVVSAAAEAEMYRITGILASTEDIIPAGSGASCAPTNGCQPNDDPVSFIQIWSSSALGGVFGSGNMPEFSNFRALNQWDQGIQNTIQSQYGDINTRIFVQELAQHETESTAGKIQITYDYLITVKAAALNPGDTNERETLVLQSVYSLHFII